MNKKIKSIILLFVFTFFLIPASFAIYKSQAVGNSALVSAIWNVTLEQTGVNNNLTVVTGGSNITYTLNVKSLSEVDVKYNVVLSNLPAGVDASLNGVDFPPVSNGTVTFNNAGTILYNSQNKTNTHTITLRAANNATIVSNQVVAVNVIAEQLVTS